jgi:hypothetical protein
VDLEDDLKRAVARAYQRAGVPLAEKHLASLAEVYAQWADGADRSVVERIERALAVSLGVATA